MPNPDKTFETRTCVIKTPDFTYVQLQLSHDGPNTPHLDEIQVKSYCNAALRQFLGLTGMAILVDILKVTDTECWLRIPREDVSSFLAAMTAFKGVQDKETQYLLRVKQHSNWLGTMVGTDNIDDLFLQ